MKNLESFLMPDNFYDISNYLDKSTILLCIYLYKYFTAIDYSLSGSKICTINDLVKDLKFSRNTVIRALEQINDNKVFVVKDKENCFPRTVIISLISYE